MSRTSKVQVKPQTITVGGQEWSMDEIQELKDLYSGRPSITKTKREIRASTIIQKAMKCEVVQNINLQQGDSATLHLAQVGYDMVAML